MIATDRVIRWTTAGAVVGVAAVAAVASMSMPMIWCGRMGRWVDGPDGAAHVDELIYASSMVMLDSARRKVSVPGLARWLLGLGIGATLAANVTHGLGHGLIGTAVVAWPAMALVGSYELLMMSIQSSHARTEAAVVSGIPDPLRV